MIKAALAIFNEGRRIKPAGKLYLVIALLGVPLTVFEIWFALLGSMQPLTLAVVFVGVLYTTTFLTISSTQNNPRLTRFDYALAALSFVCSIYLILQTTRYVEWVAGISEFTA